MKFIVRGARLLRLPRFVKKYVEISVDAQRDKQQRLRPPNEHGESRSFGVGRVKGEFAHAVKRQPENDGNVPSAQTSIGGNAHADAAEHEANKRAKDAEIASEIKCEEAHIELHEIASPYQQRI